MSEFRVATWNMGMGIGRRGQTSREAPWQWLRDSLHPNIALLQETKPSAVIGRVIWRDGGIGPRRPWSSAVASFGLPLRELRRWKGRADKTEKDLQRTYPGTVISAIVELPNVAPVAVVSLYGAMFEDGYSSMTLHRQLSDLNSLLDSRQGKRLILGGDFNCSTQFDPPYRTRLRNLFERFETYGLVNLTKARKDRRPRLENCPCDEGPECGHMQTHRHNRSKKPWQLDYLFASEYLARKVITCEVIDGSPGAWQFSDHCPVVATFNL